MRLRIKKKGSIITGPRQLIKAQFSLLYIIPDYCHWESFTVGSSLLLFASLKIPTKSHKTCLCIHFESASRNLSECTQYMYDNPLKVNTTVTLLWRTIFKRGTRPRIARAIWNISKTESENDTLKVMQISRKTLFDFFFSMNIWNQFENIKFALIMNEMLMIWIFLVSMNTHTMFALK